MDTTEKNNNTKKDQDEEKMRKENWRIWRWRRGNYERGRTGQAKEGERGEKKPVWPPLLALSAFGKLAENPSRKNNKRHNKLN